MFDSMLKPEPEPNGKLTEADDRAYFQDAGLIITELTNTTWRIDAPSGQDAGIFFHADRNGDTESHLSRRAHILRRLTR